MEPREFVINYLQNCPEDEKEEIRRETGLCSHENVDVQEAIEAAIAMLNVQ